MGRAKATLPLDASDTFLTRIVRTFLEAGVDDVVVVVGHEADAIVSSFSASGLPARFVVNHDYDRGQWSSLVAGLGVVDRPGVSIERVPNRVGGDVPQQRPPVLAARDERLAVGSEAHWHDAPGLRPDPEGDLPGRQVDEAHRSVIAPDPNRVTVGAECG